MLAKIYRNNAMVRSKSSYSTFTFNRHLRLFIIKPRMWVIKQMISAETKQIHCALGPTVFITLPNAYKFGKYHVELLKLEPHTTASGLTGPWLLGEYYVIFMGRWTKLFMQRRPVSTVST